MDDDEEEYMPDEGEMEDEEMEYGEFDDEELYLRGALTGPEDDEDDAAGQTEEEDEAADGGTSLFDGSLDPLSLLEGMQQQQEDEDLGAQQPFEVLASSKRRAKAALAAGGQGGLAGAKGPKAKKRNVFGASVEEIWEGGIADDLGLEVEPGAGFKARKRARDKERRHKKAAAKGVRSKDLPPEVSALMGQANLAYAQSNNEEVERLLTEVIKRVPNLAEPYQTLGTMCLDSGQARRALNFFMIAAHLTPKDVHQWRRMAGLSTAQGYLRQAIYCLSKVIARDKEDMDARWDRAVLYAEIGEPRKALAAFEAIAAARPGDAEAVKMLARLHHRLGAPARAMEALEQHVAQHGGSTDLTHVNILAELYMEAGRHGDTLALIQRAGGEQCHAEGLPIDLTVKAGMCAAHLGDMAAAVEQLRALLAESAAEYADLYLEVGDLLAWHALHEEALVYYERVRAERELSSPALWDRIAACQRALGRGEGSAGIYHDVINDEEADPQLRAEAALALAEHHADGGEQAAAMEVLRIAELAASAHPSASGDALGMVNRRARLLLRLGQQEAFLDLMLPVLSRSLRAFESASAAPAAGRRMATALKRRRRAAAKAAGAHETDAVFKGFVTRDRRRPHVRQADEEVAAAMEGGVTESEAESEGEGPAPGPLLDDLMRDESQFETLLGTLRVLLQNGQASEARALTEHVINVLARRWSDKSKKDALRIVLAEAALAQGDLAAALGQIRPVAQRWPACTAAWNVYARCAHSAGGARHALKFLQPLRAKHPRSLPLMLLTGHAHTFTGSYGAALVEYFHAYRQRPREPLTLLSIAAALLNQVMSKKVPDRDRAVVTVFAFLQEYALRRRCVQEAAYNLGRAAHQLGLLHLAVPLYERALAAEPPQGEAKYDMRGEVAHNLAQIYAATGALGLARQVIRQHVTI